MRERNDITAQVKLIIAMEEEVIQVMGVMQSLWMMSSLVMFWEPKPSTKRQAEVEKENSSSTHGKNTVPSSARSYFNLNYIQSHTINGD